MSEPTPTPTTQPKRKVRRTMIGVVTSDKMDKTRRVEIPAARQASAIR